MLEEYLKRDNRIVLPIGSTEQHGYLSVGTDAILAERVAVEAAEPLGVPVLPALPFGVTPYFAAFPGSPSLRTSTYISVIHDLLRLAVDGRCGGSYERPDAEVLELWRTGVSEVRDLIENGWDKNG